MRKFRFLAKQARASEASALKKMNARTLLSEVQFDDLETAEHTKCKPISVALAIDPASRKILGFQASRMPAKGRLAALSRKKYGPRPDERGKGWDRLLSSLHGIVERNATFVTDQNPHYPKHLKRHHPGSVHQAVKGKRGCVSGQGELKKTGFDPLFSLNHTCAMMRANMNRLFRRSWCLSKTLTGLEDHLWIYTRYHNEVLIHAPAR